MRSLVFLVFVVTLSGCTALMLGGGSSSGGQYDKDERTSATDDSDWSITTKVKSKHAANSRVSPFQIGVSTDSGRVTLSGSVGSYAAREMAEKLAIETDGVKAVDNQIKVEYAK